MQNKWMIIGALALTTMGTNAMAGRPKEPKMVDAAREFIALLDTGQKAKALLSMDADQRTEWYYIPRERYGLTLKEMNEAQRKAALTMLRVALSTQGNKKVETIRSLENVLREIEKGTGPLRDPENYYFAVFGTPTDKGVWGWRYEGHHTSLHWTFIDGKIAASTPQFLGTNPAEVRVEGPYKGIRVLGVEEDVARKLLKSLTADQRKDAVINDKAPADLLTTNVREVSILEDKGVAFKSLTEEQQTMLMAVVREVAELQSPAEAKARLAKVTRAGHDSIKFAWMGGPEKGDPHYYRIQGKTFLIEYDNTQNNANHVHLVWRDFKGDFGRDALKDHYKNSNHHDQK